MSDALTINCPNCGKGLVDDGRFDAHWKECAVDPNKICKAFNKSAGACAQGKGHTGPHVTKWGANWQDDAKLSIDGEIGKSKCGSHYNGAPCLKSEGHPYMHGSTGGILWDDYQADRPPMPPLAEDLVNHPKHYVSHPSGIECIDIVEHMNFCCGNAVKYIWRADLKGNAIEDLEKAKWYIEREIARRQKGSK